jgi:3-hydroxybutyrate dehydrogenase
MATSLTGKCALITGSTQGLGLATAECLAAEGCAIVLNGFADAAQIAAIRSKLESRHRVRTLYSGADLRDPAAIEGMMAASVDAFGSVDILVNNAVVRHSGPVDTFSIDQWNEALAVNLSAAFHTIRLALPTMRRRAWGRIINVSSVYGLRGAPDRVGYVTTKTALIGLTRAVALETTGQDITCNAVCPGTTESPVHEARIKSLVSTEGISTTEAERRFFAGKQPTGRFISADSVAALMVHLCGPNGTHINGAALAIDDGWSAG